MQRDEAVAAALSKKLYDMRNNELCCDLTLKCEGDKKLFVHKNVLMASISPYLGTVITDKVREFYLPISFTQLEIIVKYLYTGEISAPDSTETRALYKSAVKLDLPFVKEYSTEKLLNSVSFEFWLEYFRHSIEFKIQSLEDKCLNYIAGRTVEFFNKFLYDLLPNELERILEVRETLIIEEIELFRIIRQWIFADYPKRTLQIDKILLKYIDFLKIPTSNYYNEIANDKELIRHYNYLKKISSINKIKGQENEKSILKWNPMENYLPRSQLSKTSSLTEIAEKVEFTFPQAEQTIDLHEASENPKLKTIANSDTGQESLYSISRKGIKIQKLDIETGSSVVAYENKKYGCRSGYGICNFKDDNGNCILISGGFNSNFFNSNLLNSNLIWRPGDTNNQSLKYYLPSLSQGRAFHNTIFFDDKIYVSGGSTNNRYRTYTEILNTMGSKKWHKVPEFDNPKYEPNLITLESCLYAVGGNIYDSKVERFNFDTKSWEVISPICRTPIIHAFSCSESLILCISESKPSFIFDIRNNKFSEDFEYDCIEGLKLSQAFKYKNKNYGAYSDDNRRGIFTISQFDKNSKKYQFENDLDWCKLLTLYD